MSKKKTYEKDPRKNTRLFYTKANKDHPKYWGGSISDIIGVFKLMRGAQDYCTIHDSELGEMFIARCTPKEYDDLRLAMEDMLPGLFEWDVAVGKPAKNVE